MNKRYKIPLKPNQQLIILFDGVCNVCKSTFLLLILILTSSCGTGPWFIQKKAYKLYKEPVQENPKFHFKTNGFYQELSDLTELDSSKTVLIFNNNGYCTSLDYSKLKSLITNKKPIELDLDWWQVKHDSIIIENFGESKRLIKTSVWWDKGKILNDSIIQLAYLDKNYQHEPVKYKFIESNKVPELINTANYINKKWYISYLNKFRK